MGDGSVLLLIVVTHYTGILRYYSTSTPVAIYLRDARRQLSSSLTLIQSVGYTPCTKLLCKLSCQIAPSIMYTLGRIEVTIDP